MLRRKTTEFIGWLGVIAIIGAYALLNFGVFSPRDLSYQLLNALGALGIVIDALRQKDYQPAVLNILWAIIALFSIVELI